MRIYRTVQPLYVPLKILFLRRDDSIGDMTIAEINSSLLFDLKTRNIVAAGMRGILPPLLGFTLIQVLFILVRCRSVWKNDKLVNCPICHFFVILSLP
jgi:hypothetical protein